MKKIIFCLTVFCLLLATFLVKRVEAQKTPRTPKVAAQLLYQAWHLKNRKAALKVADKEAVDKLFSARWRAMRLKPCTRRDEGGFECVYTDAKNDLDIAFIVEGGASVGGYNVSSLSFSTEE